MKSKDKNAYASAGVDIAAADKTTASFMFGNSNMEVVVKYELDNEMPVLRKSITCQAGERGVYVSGVRHWKLKAVDSSFRWPKGNSLGQPAVLITDDDGLIFTLEWPRAEVMCKDNAVCLSYRPGFRLRAGESRQVSAGSIILFESTFERNEVSL